MEEKLDKLVSEELVSIHKTWRTWHIRILAGIVTFTLVMEAVMYFVLSSMDEMESSPLKYLVKYMLIPFLCGALNLIVCRISNKSTKISDLAKNYIISIATVLCAFYITAVHGIFIPVYSMVVMPIIFASFYADMKLISVCSAFCLLTLLLNAYVIRWDDSKTYGAMYDIDIVLFMILIFCVYTACGYGIKLEKKKTQAMYQTGKERIMLYNLSRRDELTRLYNRLGLRDFFQDLKERKEEDYFFVMMDIDHFKTVNDTLGHRAGDTVLQVLAKILLDMENNDLVPFRYGGDEFCILVRKSERKKMIAYYREISSRFVKNLPPEVKKLGISISAGASQKNSDITMAQVVENADRALYKSKYSSPKTILFFDE